MNEQQKYDKIMLKIQQKWTRTISKRLTDEVETGLSSQSTRDS